MSIGKYLTYTFLSDYRMKSQQHSILLKRKCKKSKQSTTQTFREKKKLAMNEQMPMSKMNWPSRRP